MATFVCIHGAGGRASYWDLVARELRARGHDVIAMDLPCEEDVGLDAYVQCVVDAIGDRRSELVLVAQSLAGLVAPLVCTRVPIELMVLVAAMVPSPGESGMEWWANTGHDAAVVAQGLPDDSPEALFTHDVPPDVLAAAGPPRDQTGTLFEEPWPLREWPDVPTRFLLCRDDRFFPAAWLRQIVRDRLGIDPDEIPGGHCAFLSQPVAMAEALDHAWRQRAAANGPAGRAPERHRAVVGTPPVERQRYGGLSYEEIAAALGVPLGTVRSRLSRARARLRELAGLDGQVRADTTIEEPL